MTQSKLTLPIFKARDQVPAKEEKPKTECEQWLKEQAKKQI